MFRFGLTIVVSCFVLACGGKQGPPPCGPNNCAGCCSTSGQCELGVTNNACGFSGAACQFCLGGDVCQAGRCLLTGSGGGSSNGGGAGTGGGSSTGGGGGSTGGGVGGGGSTGGGVGGGGSTGGGVGGGGSTGGGVGGGGSTGGGVGGGVGGGGSTGGGVGGGGSTGGGIGGGVGGGGSTGGGVGGGGSTGGGVGGGGAGDVDPPSLTAFAFSPASVNCTNGSALVTFTATATDNLSGVSAIYAEFMSPSGNQTQSGYAYSSNRVSGTALNGTYSFTATFPQFAESGTWTLYYVQLNDVIGNYQTLYTADLQARGLPTTVSVTSAADTMAPSVSAFAFSPNAVNTGASSATITFNATATDNLSGVSAIYAEFMSPSGNQTQSGYAYSSNRTSGTALNGTYSFSATFPQYAEAGTWTLYYVQANDVIGNYVTLYTADLTTMGFPTTLTVSGASDTSPPGLSAFSFSPATVSTSSASATVTLNATVTDNLSGVSAIYVEFMSPSGNQTQSGYAYSSNRTSGTALNGTYSFTATIPQFAETGTWTVYYVQANDVIGNYVTLYTADLQTRGLPTTLTVQ